MAGRDSIPNSGRSNLHRRMLDCDLECPDDPNDGKELHALEKGEAIIERHVLGMAIATLEDICHGSTKTNI